jgi:CDP-diacylglycerol--glycerol-3-phosphate 3-phosphatidyltransferase
MIRFVPNILTVARLVLSIVVLAMILYAPDAVHRTKYLDVVFVLFVIAGLTDIIDGKIARKYNASTKFGRMLDPLVDKVLICGGFICFAVIGWPTLFSLSHATNEIIIWLVAGIITLREIIMTVVRHIAESRGINFAATPAGKLKMFVQSFAIGTILVKTAHVPETAWGNWFTAAVLAICAAITIISALPAVRRSDWRT